MNTTIHLQGVGNLPAQRAIECKVGDVLIWNYGETETIEEIIKTTAKQIIFKVSTVRGGIFIRRCSKERLVAIR